LPPGAAREGLPADRGDAGGARPGQRQPRRGGASGVPARAPPVPLSGGLETPGPRHRQPAAVPPPPTAPSEGGVPAVVEGVAGRGRAALPGAPPGEGRGRAGSRPRRQRPRGRPGRLTLPWGVVLVEGALL